MRIKRKQELQDGGDGRGGVSERTREGMKMIDWLVGCAWMDDSERMRRKISCKSVTVKAYRR